MKKKTSELHETTKRSASPAKRLKKTQTSRQGTDRERLKESEERFRLLLEAAEEGIAIHDKGIIVVANQALAGMFGYELSEMIGMYTEKLATPESWKVIQEHVTTGNDQSYEAVGVRKDSTTFICSLVGKPYQYKERTLRVATFHDITGHKQMEYELRASEMNFHHSLDESPLGVRISTIEGETIYANKAILEIYGYDNVEELKKISIKERYTPESYAEFQERKKKRVQGEFGPSEYEIGIVRKNGEIRHLHVFRKEIFWNGKKQSQVIYLDITGRRQAEEKLSRTLENLRQSIKTTIQVLGLASEARDPYTAGHHKRVSHLARAIATEMELPHHIVEGIRMAGSIHDIGKLSVPGEILSKPTKLSDLEFSLIKGHPEAGYEMLKNVESPWPLADIVYQHHERLNGTGYPRNLKVDDILIAARVMAVADVVEAMASHRPYRPAPGVEAALEEIGTNRGVLYDEAVVDACLKLFRDRGYELPKV